MFCQGADFVLAFMELFAENIGLFILTHPKVGINFGQLFSYFEHLKAFSLETQRGYFHPWSIWLR
jgi:hypothetical protein